MNYSRRTARRTARREFFTLGSYAGLVTFTLAALAFGLLVEMAVYTAHGNKLHIGADILFAGFSSVQLIYMAVTAGLVSMAAIVATAVCAILAGAR